MAALVTQVRPVRRDQRDRLDRVVSAAHLVLTVRLATMDHLVHAAQMGHRDPPDPMARLADRAIEGCEENQERQVLRCDC